jgi:hypothetical protein
MASAISFGDANAGFQVGIVNGPVSTTFHLPLGEFQECPKTVLVRARASTNESPASDRRETPPPPSIVIPFGRDADFIERGTTLDQVLQKCAAQGSRAALVGLGGVG